MATTKQKAAVKKILGNPGIPIGRAMREVGYSDHVADTPQSLTESKGFKELLADYGLTEELVTTSLVDDIKAKPRKRFLELNLGAEILGMKDRVMPKDEAKKVVVAVQVIVNGANNAENRANAQAEHSS